MKKHRRTMAFDRSAIDPEARTVELSVSSDTDSVRRYVRGYGEVAEILGHRAGEVDFGRFLGLGGPLLYNHDFDELIGRFTATGVEGGKLRGVARFGNGPRASALFRDLRDGILRDVSITYDYDSADVEVTEKNRDGSPRAVRVKRWTPLEVSFVTVPADPTVGVGRSYYDEYGGWGETGAREGRGSGGDRGPVGTAPGPEGAAVTGGPGGAGGSGGDGPGRRRPGGAAHPESIRRVAGRSEEDDDDYKDDEDEETEDRDDDDDAEDEDEADEDGRAAKPVVNGGERRVCRPGGSGGAAPAGGGPEGRTPGKASASGRPSPRASRAITETNHHKENTVNTSDPIHLDGRTAQILKLADQFGVAADKRNEWLGQGASVEQVQQEILDGYRSAAKPLAAPSDALGLTDRERRGYSVATALRAIVTGDPGVGGLEREVSAALAAKLGRNTGGILIPTDMPMRDAHNTKVLDAAGNLVFKEYAGYLEMLKNAAVVLQMGASVTTGLQGTPTWVKQTGASTTFWVDENPATGVTESNLTWQLVTSTPKTAKALLRYTRQQVLQSVEAFEPLLQKDLLEQDTLAIDSAALVGTGSAFQPLGLLNTPGIQSHSLGANGAKPGFSDITRLKTLVKKANALGLGEGGYLTTPEIEDLLMTTPRLNLQIAQAIWGEDNRLAGYRALGANQVPSNLTKGSSAGNCHAIIFGIWSEMFLLEWGALEMVVDPYSEANKDIVRVTTSHLVDVFVRRPQAFAAIKDALAS